MRAQWLLHLQNYLANSIECIWIVEQYRGTVKWHCFSTVIGNIDTFFNVPFLIPSIFLAVLLDISVP